MSDNAPIKLIISEDRNSVVLQQLPPGVSAAIVHEELKLLNVTNGILIKEIEEAVQRVQGGKAVNSLVVAQGGRFQLEIVLVPLNKKMNFKEFRDFEARLNKVYFGLKSKKDFNTDSEYSSYKESLFFIKKGQSIVRVAKTVVNVFGDIDSLDPGSSIVIPGEDMAVEDRGEYFEYLARESGYLIFTDDHCLDVLKPLQANADEDELFALIEPVTTGKSELDDVIREFADVEYLESKNKNLNDILTKGFGFLCIRKKREPQEGKNAQLVGLVEKKKVAVDEDDKIDYKALSSFLHVGEHMEIAKKIPPAEGVAGLDIWKVELPVGSVSDRDFNVGENIVSEERDGVIIYKSAVEGVLYVKDNHINVSEGLIIEGDVDNKTGNISYEKDVIITGSLTEGFAVESGGNVQIQGSVGNHCQLLVKKNLEVLKGIFGVETRVTVKGNADIGFVQESTIKVDGNCMVHRFLYQSNFFCGGVLEVEGASIKGQTKGAIIGGVTNALKGIKAHSAGSGATKTELIAGINIELRDKLGQLEKALDITSHQITALEANVGMDLANVETAKKLKSLSPSGKAAMKEKLISLKDAIGNRKKIEESIEKVKGILATQDVTNAFIEIKNKIIPDVIIRLGRSTKLIKTEETNQRFKSVFNEIVHSKDGHYFRDDGSLVSDGTGKGVGEDPHGIEEK